MNKQIKTIIFDLGGVILTIDRLNAVKRFEEVGVTEAATYLDDYAQQGIFGQLEAGEITAEQFREALSELCGHRLSHADCLHGWTGYAVDLPTRNLDALLRLRSLGYRVVLLSNTNPYMMEWAMSDEFDGHGNGLDYYFDAMYLSYRCGVMKPDRRIFEQLLAGEHVHPNECLFIDDGPRNAAAGKDVGMKTILASNGGDWRHNVEQILEIKLID